MYLFIGNNYTLFPSWLVTSREINQIPGHKLGHKYLIEQVQQTTDGIVGSTGSSAFPINFNHPVKELIWVVQRKQAMSLTYAKNSYSDYDYNDIFNYTASATASYKYNMIDEMNLQLNGMDLLSKREHPRSE